MGLSGRANESCGKTKYMELSECACNSLTPVGRISPLQPAAFWNLSAPWLDLASWYGAELCVYGRIYKGTLELDAEQIAGCVLRPVLEQRP